MSEEKPQSAVTWVYEHSKHTGNVYQVLRTLAIAYAEQGACLSVKEIAEQTRVSQTTVRNALKLLEQDGTIEVIKNGGTKRRNGVTNCYRLVGFQPGAQDVAPETTGTPSYSTTPSSTPTQRSSTTPSYIPPANPENAPVYVSDAAGEKDLSEKQKAKEKDKKLLSPSKTGDSQAIPKKSTPAPRQPNPLFDGIAQHIFGFVPENKAGISAAAPRIGRMLKEFPADKDTLTAERIAQFARWWTANKKTPDGKPLSKPLTAEKLATHWSDFERANPVQSAQSREEAARRQEENRAQLEQENRRQQLEMLGALP